MPGQHDVTESARSVRRCKACSHPVKGHPGPFGLAKCRNKDGVDRSSLKQEIVELANALEAVDVNVTMARPVDEKNESDVPSGGLEDLTPDLLGPSVKDDFGHDMASENVIAKSAGNNIDEKSAEERCDPNKLLKEVVIDHVNDKSDSKGYENQLSSKDASFGDDSDVDASHLLSDEEDFAQKIDDIVARLEESLIEIPNPPDQTLTSLDIRSVLAGGQFCICKCPPGSDVSSCECEGELQLDCNLSGVIKRVYMDPSQDFKVDWKPSVTCGARGWNKENSSLLVLSMVEVENEGVKVLEGNMTIEAFFVNEDEGLSGEVRGTMELVVEVGKKFEKKGFKSPIRFNPVQFQLVRLEE